MASEETSERGGVSRCSVCGPKSNKPDSLCEQIKSGPLLSANTKDPLMNAACRIAPMVLWLGQLAAASLAHAELPRISPGETLTLTQDLVLTGDDVLQFVGTADQPCTIVGGGHQVRTSDTWRGRLTLTHCRIRQLGTAALKPEFPAIAVQAKGDAVVTIEHCVFDECAGVSVTNLDKSTTIFRQNTVLANSLVPVVVAAVGGGHPHQDDRFGKFGKPEPK